MNKKIIFVALFMMSLFTLNAQRAAVMEFKAGVGISQADVDGISGIFTTYFRPSGYTMVERTQIDRVIDEQGFQRSRLTESQMVRIGQILNVSKIVIGDVNVVMGQYNVDVRVINVESGTIAATEGATFSGSSYRISMQNVAQKLASKIAIGAGPTVSGGSSSANPTPKSRTQVETVYGYLHVFPNELGVFQSEPTTVINQINKGKSYGYNKWRIPTNEELALLRASGYLRDDRYMTEETKSGIVLLVTTDKSIAEKEAIRAKLLEQGYVDLGLPSGTLWKRLNESPYATYYTHDEAMNKFGNKLPSKQQFEELKNSCSWSWSGSVYSVTGPNGNKIAFFPAGRRDSYGGVGLMGSRGWYWSSSEDCYLYIDSSEAIVECYGGPSAGSVRLVYSD